MPSSSSSAGGPTRNWPVNVRLRPAPVAVNATVCSPTDVRSSTVLQGT